MVMEARMEGNLYIINGRTKEKASINMANTSKYQLWHQRFGHIGDGSLEQMTKQQVVQGLLAIMKSNNAFCNECTLNKLTRIPCPTTVQQSTYKLQLIHSNICSPMQMATT